MIEEYFEAIVGILIAASLLLIVVVYLTNMALDRRRTWDDAAANIAHFRAATVKSFVIGVLLLICAAFNLAVLPLGSGLILGLIGLFELVQGIAALRRISESAPAPLSTYEAREHHYPPPM